MITFYFYNTASRKKEEFVPIVPEKVGVYSCGPTVYWNQHIGNMYAFVAWDVLVRSLKYAGYETRWVMNITDVGHLTDDADSGEDKMEKGARRDGISAWEVAKKYEVQFLESLNLLNVDYPRDKNMPHATDYIKEQIAMTETLLEKDLAYQIDDGVYFDTSKFDDYAKFGKLNLEELREGASIEKNDQKKNPCDFALWKFSPSASSGQAKRQMEWPSPWGVGFPGWHIECTAMSTKLLGNKFDIHTGGQEHIKVHHTNEIAQGWGVFGDSTANYWLHNGWLQLKDSKMSKSLGNVYTVQDLVAKGIDPRCLRLLFLSSHYRKGVVFSFEGLESAKRTLTKIVETLHATSLQGGQILESYKARFLEKLADDLALPEAMAVVHEMLKSDEKTEDKLATWLDFDKVLGLNLDFSEKDESVPLEIIELAKARVEAKKSKDWIEADKLRDKIKSLGYAIEDTADSYIVKKISV